MENLKSWRQIRRAKNKMLLVKRSEKSQVNSLLIITENENKVNKTRIALVVLEGAILKE